jgi:hypothetical protein
VALTRAGDNAAYGSLYDRSYGKLGNLIYISVEQAAAEVKPTTGSFTWIPSVGTVDLSIRVNGGAELTPATLAAAASPSTVQAAINSLTGVDCTGGALRSVIPGVVGNLTVTASGNQITIAYTGTWATTPSVGDTLTIASASPIDGGASDQNVGAYVVTSATSNTIVATKLSDAGKIGAVAGTITAPVNVASTAVTATTDFRVYAPLVITLTGSTMIDGQGKSLEINQLTSGTDLLERCAYALSTTPVTWVSKAGSPKLLTSAAEYSVTLKVNRQVDGVHEEMTVGGQIALKIGYSGTSCAVVVGADSIALTPTGGSGTSHTLQFADYPTLADLATYINAQAGFTCAVGTTTLGQLAPTALDEGTFACGTTFGNQTLRLKVDAVKFWKAVSENSAVVQLGENDKPATAGLPAVKASTYLAGGTRGATTDAIFNAAIDALETVQGNFLVPLFSRDAVDDIADGLTDSASSYTIDNINAYAKTHVLRMSTLKRRKNRQAFVSYRGTFSKAKDVASNLASALVSCAFQDFKGVSSTGGITQFQPWATAVNAAAMQAAGFYRSITNKGINTSGVLQAAGDFKDSNDSHVEDALLAGLLVAKKSSEGGYRWVSDQTTYSRDNNFVYNSIQANYVAAIIALTTAQRMERAFVGQSVADVSAALALSALEGIMANFLSLKLIAPSDDAPKGFRNAIIRISGTAMVVSVEVKLAGAIYFIPINFLVSQVSQTA